MVTNACHPANPKPETLKADKPALVCHSFECNCLVVGCVTTDDSIYQNLVASGHERAVLDAINATIPAAVLVARIEDGKVLLANAEARDLLGEGVTELFGDSWNSLFVSPEAREEILVRFSAEGYLRNYEVEIITAAGDHAWVVVSMTSVDSAEDDLLVLTMIDVTPIKTLQRKAEESNLAKTQFLSNMSHELHTPLNAVLGFSQMLESDPDQPLTPDQTDSVLQIWTAGRHLKNLIDDILDLTRFEDGKVNVRIADIDLQDLLSGCVQLISEQAEGSHVTVLFEDKRNILVQADGNRLRQAVMNILNNAVKFSNPDGKVEITVHPQTGEIGRSDHVTISIRDEGPGIAEEELENLFRPFGLESMQNDAMQGAGIGLAIANNVMKAMQGRITVESETGKGSVFSLHTPKASLPD